MHPQPEKKRGKNRALSNPEKLDLRNKIQERFGSQAVPWFRWVFAKLDLPTGARVLELGCGSGALWQENASRIPPGWHITLTDQAPEMTQQALARLAGIQRRLRFAAADASALPFPSESFDAVLAVGLLDLVPDLNRALGEIRRVLLPSGVLLVSAGGKGHLEELERLLRPFIPEEKAAGLGGRESRFGLDNGEQVLSPYFKAIERREYSDRLVFAQLQPVLDYVLSEHAIARELSPDDLDRFNDRIKSILDQHGPLEVSVRKGIFLARNKPR